MIKFNKEKYNKHYGKLINIMSIIGIVIILIVTIVGYVVLSEILYSNPIFHGLETKLIFLFILFMIVLFLLILYKRYKTIARAKKIKICFIDKKQSIFISDTAKSGLSLSANAPVQTIIYEYMIPFSQIKSWSKDNRWYYLNGLFIPIIEIDGIPYESNEVKTRLRIPRAFDGEEGLDSVLDSICQSNIIDIY